MSKLYNVSIDLMLGNTPYFESEEYAKAEAEEAKYDELRKKLESVLKELEEK